MLAFRNSRLQLIKRPRTSNVQINSLHKQKPAHVCSRKSDLFLNLWAGQHAHTLEPQDHEAVADGDDEDGHDEGKDEDADLQQGVPVPGGVGENQLAVHNIGGCAGGGGDILYMVRGYNRDTKPQDTSYSMFTTFAKVVVLFVCQQDYAKTYWTDFPQNLDGRTGHEPRKKPLDLGAELDKKLLTVSLVSQGIIHGSWLKASDTLRELISTSVESLVPLDWI